MALAREAADGLKLPRRTGGRSRAARPPLDEDVIQVANDYYIRATSARRDDHYRVLKHDDTFAVFDRAGDIQPYGLGEQGMFHEGTRFLSQLELRLQGQRPIVLSSAVSRTNELLIAHLENPDVPAPGDDRRILLARGQLHVARTKFLWRAGGYERMQVSNYGLHPCAIASGCASAPTSPTSSRCGARGGLRRGQLLEPLVERGLAACCATSAWIEVLRQTRLVFSRTPRRADRRGGLVRAHGPGAGERDGGPAGVLRAGRPVTGHRSS